MESKNEMPLENSVVAKDHAPPSLYGENEFGSRMHRNFIAVKRSSNVKETMKTLVSEAAENDNVYTIFALNEDDSLYGAIDLRDLIVARSNVELSSLIRTAFPFVYDKDIISESIERLREYSENTIPVISGESKALLGVITAADITELLDEERGNDYAKLAAMTAEQEAHEGLFSSMKKRVPWLIALLFMGLAVSAAVGLFEGVVAAMPMIVSFQSLILGMAGNVGTQSLAVTVRALGSKESHDLKRQLLTVFKEIRVALLSGVVLGTISFVIVSGYLLLFTPVIPFFALTTAGCVGLAMCFAMTVSGFTGAAIPIGLYRLGIDPAVASGPLITTVNDLVAVLSYYGLAWVLLLKL